MREEFRSRIDKLERDMAKLATAETVSVRGREGKERTFIAQSSLHLLLYGAHVCTIVVPIINVRYTDVAFCQQLQLQRSVVYLTLLFI